MAKTVLSVPDLARRPIDKLLYPVTQFLRVEASAGVLLLICTVIAMAWANSPWHESYEHFWHTEVEVGFGSSILRMSLHHFVNDGLMAIFFFVVGLEIKRELLVGELASFRRAALPAAAAVGGMVVPALIYVGVVLLRSSGSEETDALHGWAIPAATDIAFAIGVLAVLGSRVPLAVKVFVTALAIVDDIGAVVMIALFYTNEFSFLALEISTALIILSAVLNWAGVRSPITYGLIGVVLWLMLLQSGVHATIGGVLLALTIPSRMRIPGSSFVAFVRQMLDRFEKSGAAKENILSDQQSQGYVQGIERACDLVQTPLNRLEHNLHPWVAFGIMPVFALANAGVHMTQGFDAAMASSAGLGVALGLLLGKPIGIMLATWLAVKSGLGALPAGMTWRHAFGASMLCGIGFTMSLFISNLAFRSQDLAQSAKVGILTGSLFAAVLGFLLLMRAGVAAEAEAPATDPLRPASAH
ncbi:MAG: Na+/H+ antiporter NhaA [Phycisphaeraceae bacterium]|nr:Na+/H+ antiporter NhaA [Phycisphaeraceae bacterium]